MTGHGPEFELPSRIEHYLAVLSKVYAKRGDRRKQEIIVNARVRVHEGWDSRFDFNEEWYGHALYLEVPENIFTDAVEERDALQNEIKTDVNGIQNIPHEHIAAVFLEMQEAQDRDWRQESGVLVSPRTVVAPSAKKQIWGERSYRLFLSHRASVKRRAGNLKEKLATFGISAFVAHADIRPTKEWQREIENALASMDAFAVLLTKHFHESNWTDQEVGYAVARGVPLIAVKLGRDPYGFIGKFQALACSWESAPVELVRLLINKPGMLDAYIDAAERCRSFDQGNDLSKTLGQVDSMTKAQANRLMNAFNRNRQLRESYGFNGEKPYYYGDGLAAHLSRATGAQYVMTSSGQIKLKRR